jgi:hypothetical protein
MYLPIVFTIFLLIFDPTSPQMRTYFKVDRFTCNFSKEFFLENASCRADPIDRDTKLVSLYGMACKAANDVSVIQLPNLLIDF